VTTIRTVATHDIVQSLFPRTVTDQDKLGMAVGRAIDSALAQFSYDFRQSRRPTVSAMSRVAESLLDEGLAEVDTEVTTGERQRLAGQVTGVLQSFRRSEVFGLLRPKSRLILVQEVVGVYAQPDYWNGRDRIYEMKSYPATLALPDVKLQLEIFQLAFPGFRTVLATFDRFSSPVVSKLTEVAPLEARRRDELLRMVHQKGLELGEPKVLEYIDHPAVRYSLPA